MNNSYQFEDSVGLENIGNSCYMNSALQMLYSINEYRDLIFNTKFTNDTIDILKQIFILIKFNNSTNYIKKHELINLYGNLYKEIYQKIFGIDKIFHGGKLEQKKPNIVQKINKKNSVFGSQQDSHELLTYIIANTFDSNNFDTNFFSFELIDGKYCSKNGSVNDLETQSDKVNFLELPVLLEDRTIIGNSISELIKNFITNEKLGVEEQIHRCSDNGKDSYKKLDIKIPEENKYLFIQLKRLLKNFKLGIELYFDGNINIDYQLYIDGNRYDLIGVILRSGSYRSGHYIYTTIKNGKIHKVYDDESVFDNLRDWNKLEKHAYVLLYRKYEKKESNNLKRNAKINAKINAKVNAKINAKVNAKINAKKNSEINPETVNTHTNNNTIIKIATEKIKEMDKHILELLEDRRRILQFLNTKLIKHSDNILKKEEQIKKELSKNKRYIKIWERKVSNENNNLQSAINIASNNSSIYNYNTIVQLQEKELEKYKPVKKNSFNTNQSNFNENALNLASINSGTHNFNTIVNLQQKELNNYAKKKQINNNKKLALKLQQEYNNEQLALQLEREEYNNMNK